jgi:hypothetical protein
VADLSLKKALQDALKKSVLKPIRRREIVEYLMGRYGAGNRKACRCVRLHRSLSFYRSRMNPLTELRQRARQVRLWVHLRDTAS